MLVGDLDTPGDRRNLQATGQDVAGSEGKEERGGGRRSGDWMGPAPLRGGWGRGGVPTPGGTLRGSEDAGRTQLVFPLPNLALGSLLGSRARSSPLQGPLWLHWS